jgi:RHS repeat-associated protein
MRLTAITNKTGGAATLSYYNYTLDNAGRSTQESWQSQNTTGGTISGTHTYTYDATNQLTAADGAPYSYDLNGNQTMAGYQTGAANRLTNDGTWTYTYDAEGNLTQKSKGSGLETWYYGYDTVNRLTSVEKTSNGTALLLTVTYTYDVLSRRLEEDDWQTGGVVTVTKTAYDGGAAWTDLNGSGTIQTRYILVLAGNQWGGRIDASGVEWLLTDRLGSIRDVVNSAGTLVLDHTEYQAFGAVASDTNAAVAGALGFEGEREDRNTGNVATVFRGWNTLTHQFDEEDPIQFGGGDGNLRRLVGNNPANAVDPSGMDWEWAPREAWPCIIMSGGFPGGWVYQKVRSCPTYKFLVGVDSFKVEYLAHRNFAHDGIEFKVDVHVHFKDTPLVQIPGGNTMSRYVAALADYRQIASGSTKINGAIVPGSERNNADDNYSRADDVDNNPPSSANFHTVDYPGYNTTVIVPGQGETLVVAFKPGDKVEDTTTLTQRVIDKRTGEVIAEIGPHTVTATGTFPNLTFSGLDVTLDLDHPK